MPAIPYRVLCIESCFVEGRHWKEGEVYESNIDLATNYSSFFQTFTGEVYSPATMDFFVDLDGTLWANGHFGWNDEKFPVSIVNPPGIASDPDIDPLDGSLLFGAIATELIYVWAQLSHKVIPGSYINPHIHWTATDGTAGNVLWNLQYKYIPTGGDTTIGFTDTVIPVVAADEVSIETDFPSILVPTTGSHSAMYNFKISREGADGTDTYAADAKLYEFDFHYKTNVLLGSGREYQL